MLKKLFRTTLVSYFFSIKIISNLILKNSTIIVAYHGISFQPSVFYKTFNLNIDPFLFEKQILWLKENFNIISPIQLLNKNYKKPAVLITFDDGDKSYIKNAIPILKKYNIPSINFLNMAVIKGELSWAGITTYLTHKDKNFLNFIKTQKKYKKYKKDKNYYLNIDKKILEKFYKKINRKYLFNKIKTYCGKFLSKNDLKILQNNNLVYIGNHLYNHYNVTNLSDKDLKNLYNLNQKEIDKYKNSLNFFAYPFGKKHTCYNSKTTSIINKLGAKAIFSNNPLGFNSKNNFFHRLSLSSQFSNRELLISHLVLLRLKHFFKNS